MFFKLGTIGFGGSAAHIAMMEEEVVERRGWISRERFLDLVGVTSIIPGPNSTEMAIHLGFVRGGWLGLVLAGGCFIFPAVVLTTVLAWAYLKFGAVAYVAWLLYGVKPAVLAVILGAVWRLGKNAMKEWRLSFLGLAVMLVALTEFSGVLALVGGGLLGMFWLRMARPRSNLMAVFVPMAGTGLSMLTGIGAVVGGPTLWALG
ncbi:MAG: chromate transporter, partial [Candidatus Latescibacteria bacterium]|nr:chromate transporter [Candidatus Latescibacterota bacterium]